MKKLMIVLLIAIVALSTVFAAAEAEKTTKKKLTIAAESWEITKINLEWCVEQYKANHPDVEVELVTVADSGVLTNYILDWSKGNTDVDLVFLDGGLLAPSYAAKGLIYDFDKELNFFSDYPRSNFQPGTLDTGLVKGVQVCMPAIYEVYAISLNKAMFKEAGLVDEKGEPLPINSWDDFYNFAEKLTKKDASGNVTQIGASIQFGNNLTSILGAAIIAEYGDAYAADGFTYNVDTPEIKHMLELWQKGVLNEYITKATFTENAGGRNAFKAGKVAMCYEAAGRWMEAIPTVGEENLALAAVPGKDGSAYCFGCQMVIPKASKSADLACQFIKECVYAEETQVKAFQQYGKMSVISKYFVKALDATPLWKSINKSMSTAKVLNPYDNHAEYLKGLQTIFQSGLVDPKTTAQDMANAIIELTNSIK